MPTRKYTTQNNFNNFLLCPDSPEKIQSFMLSTDEEINEGIPLVINCNADVVMLPVKYNTIEKVTIKRRLHGSRDFGEIVTYDIYSVEEINVCFPNNLHKR